jgi:hypothetical protein
VIVLASLTTGCNAAFDIDDAHPRPHCADPLIIDDMEDGDTFICASNERKGSWYREGDQDGPSDWLPKAELEPERVSNGARGESLYAQRLDGPEFPGWGTLMGFSLNTQQAGKDPYDASSTHGITFWMKSNVSLFVEFLMPQTELTGYGGECVGRTADPNCHSHFSFQITAPSRYWEKYVVPFDALKQKMGGSVDWNPQYLNGINFQVPSGAPFDVWVDDIQFIDSCSGLTCMPSCTDPNFPVVCPGDVHAAAAGCFRAGTDCATLRCGSKLLIDDMEDRDARICTANGWSGSWYTVGLAAPTDSTTESNGFALAPLHGARAGSLYAARMNGSGVDSWGALMGFHFNSVEATVYDAKAMSGIHFWMKSETDVRVEFPTESTTHEEDEGPGTCTANCGDHFHFELKPMDNNWKEYWVPFKDLLQWEPGSAAWKPSKIIGIQFVAQGEFDVWVDDLRFYE